MQSEDERGRGMSMVSELVYKLRTEVKSMGEYGTDYIATLLTRSADAIEILSEKAKEPKQGEWIFHSEWEEYWCRHECSLCGRTFDYETNYCPYCGCAMTNCNK